MYAAVAYRTREIGALRALGLSRRSILIAFVSESLALSLISGLSGVALSGVLGLAGGFLPARLASPLPITQALRQIF